MKMVQVRALTGRVAFARPNGTRRIPNNEFVTLPETPWLRRLADVHGDIELKRLDKKQRNKTLNKKAEEAQAEPVKQQEEADNGSNKKEEVI